MKLEKKLNILHTGPIVSKGLQIDISTNKGTQDLLFSEGETLKLYVQANRPCYLRIVYYLVDKSRILLLDNYYMDTSKVNKIYEIPYEFQCIKPFGAEVLSLNAQEERFETLRIQRSEEGYDFIEENIEQIVANNRALKKVNNISIYRAEKHITITTMK